MSVECFRIAKISCQRQDKGQNFEAIGEVICKTTRCPLSQPLPKTTSTTIAGAIAAIAEPADQIVRDTICPKTKQPPIFAHGDNK